MSEGPWTFSEARQKCLNAAGAQKLAEGSLKEAAKNAATAEENYRIALAEEIVRQNASGAAWTVAADLAKGERRVAELRRKRDIAEGVREAMVQLAWRRSADRKDAQRFSDWSQRRELAEGVGAGQEPDWSLPRAAA